MSLNIAHIISYFRDNPDPTSRYIADGLEWLMIGVSGDGSSTLLPSWVPSKNWVTDNAPLPRGYIGGFQLSQNASDSSHDLDITLGECRDSTDAVNIELAAPWPGKSNWTKKFDAVFAVGHNKGGNLNGNLTADTYHLFVIKRDSDNQADIAASTSVSCSNRPDGWTYFRRVGSLRTSGTAWKPFFQQGDEFFWKTPYQHSATIGSTASGSQLQAAMVPTGFKMRADIHLFMEASPSPMFFSFVGADAATFVPSADNNTITADTDHEHHHIRIAPLTNTNAEYKVNFSTGVSTSAVFYFHTHGWIDNRGKDA